METVEEACKVSFAVGDRAEHEASYNDLVARHHAAVRAYVLKLTGNAGSAEDVTQETFLRAWRHRDRLAAGPGSVRAWLFTVAHNIAVDLIRGRRSWPVGDELLERLQPPAGDHADAVVDSVALRPALSRLSSEHRAVVFELYFRRRTVAEAARSIGVPPGTVKSRAHNAVRALRADLASAA
jgi:RNA polymerase sigma-70 factor, ECF subfamily